MSKKTIIITTAIASLTISGLSIPAYAAEPTPLSNELTVAALNNLGLEDVDQSIIDAVSSNIASAVESGVIDDNIVDIVEDTIVEPSPEPTEPPVTEPTPEPTEPPIVEPSPEPTEPPLEDEMDRNLEEETDRWEQVKTDWQAAFETVKTEFQDCVSAGGNSSDCAQGLGFKLQIAHAQVLLDNYDKRVAEIGNLPEEEQAEALQRLEEHREKTVQRLEKANQLLNDHMVNGTPLSEGVRIKDLPGEAELVNGLLASLGSEERVIPKDAERIKKNSDGTVTVERSNGETKQFRPERFESENSEGTTTQRPAPQQGQTSNTPQSQRPAPPQESEEDSEDTRPAPQQETQRPPQQGGQEPPQQPSQQQNTQQNQARPAPPQGQQKPNNEQERGGDRPSQEKPERDN